MKTLTDIWLLSQRFLTQLLRNPVWLVVGFSTPILYLALFTPLLTHLAGDAGLPSGNVLDLFLPISLGPAWMRALAHFDPLYYLVAASRILAAGTFSGAAVWQAFAVLGPLSTIVLTWATAVVRKAVS